jgi:hypothetical protein
MRRFLLTLTLTSFSGWSQPAQQPAQPPIVVQVQMPVETLSTTLLKLAIPTLLGAGLGAGLTLYGVRLTNKHNAAENAATRQHSLDIERIKDEIAADAKSRDNRWTFRRDIYVNLIEATTALIGVYSTMRTFHTAIQATPPLATDPLIARKRSETAEAFGQAVKQFNRSSALASLATAEDVLLSIQQVLPGMSEWVDVASPDHLTYLKRQMLVFDELRSKLQAAGRKDLWGTTGNEAKVAEAAAK